jgi:hypothetical protein
MSKDLCLKRTGKQMAVQMLFAVLVVHHIQQSGSSASYQLRPKVYWSSCVASTTLAGLEVARRQRRGSVSVRPAGRLQPRQLTPTSDGRTTQLYALQTICRNTHKRLLVEESPLASSSDQQQQRMPGLVCSIKRVQGGLLRSKSSFRGPCTVARAS